MALTFQSRSNVPDPREIKRMIDRLIEAENEVLKLRAEWAALFKQQPEEDVARGSLAEKIAKLINDNFERNYTMPQVSEALGANPNSVGPTLSRLVAENKIRKVAHGEYRGFTPRTIWEEPDTMPHAQESPQTGPV